MNPIDTLQDDFNDNSLDTAKWTNWGGGQVVETNGELQITTTTSATYYGIDSAVNYNLTGNRATIRITDAGAVAYTTRGVGLNLILNSSNVLSFFVGYGSQTWAKIKVAGVWTTIASAAYNSTNHQYFRIRENGGYIFFDTSADGKSYTNFASVANPFAVTSLMVEIWAGCDGVEAGNSLARLDSFNIGNIDYGAAVSQKGYDVKNCADRFLVWSSSFQNFKVFNRYSVSTTVPAGADNIITITHNLGYFAPFFIVYNGPGNNEGQFMIGRTGFITFGSSRARNYPNSLQIIVANGFDAQPNGTTVYFTVYILLNDLTAISESIVNSSLSSGASSSDYGIRVSKDGYDVKSCTNDQLAFSSSFPNYIIDKIEVVTINSLSNYYVYHSLGYVPNVFVYKELSVDTGYISMAFFRRGSFLIAQTDQRIRLLTNSSSNYGTYYVVILKDKLN